jgi:exoribonuclease-2
MINAASIVAIKNPKSYNYLMIAENALVVYKNKPALIKEKTADKLVIALASGETVKVREKDIELIHPGPVKSLNGISETGTSSADGTKSTDAAVSAGTVRETWELLLVHATVSATEFV